MNNSRTTDQTLHKLYHASRDANNWWDLEKSRWNGTGKTLGVYIDWTIKARLDTWVTSLPELTKTIFSQMRLMIAFLSIEGLTMDIRVCYAAVHYKKFEKVNKLWIHGKTSKGSFPYTYHVELRNGDDKTLAKNWRTLRTLTERRFPCNSNPNHVILCRRGSGLAKASQYCYRTSFRATSLNSHTARYRPKYNDNYEATRVS